MMPPTIARSVLRAVAILIAVAGVADPVVSLDRVPPRRVTVVTALTGAAADTRLAVMAALGREMEIQERVPVGRKLPCPPDQPCVVVADGSVDLDLPTAPHKGAPSISLIKVGPGPGPNVELTSAIVSSHQHSSASGSVHVELRGVGVTGRSTAVRVSEGSAVLGSAVHDWKADGQVSLDVRWWPITDGAQVLHVEAVPIDGEVTIIDNRIDAGVTVDASTVPVLVFDPRPSWASTFVRRALEDDPRFVVRSRARLGPTLAAGTSSAGLDEATLQSASVVIVGAPDALNLSEVGWLDRYVRIRGGTLVLLANRAPAGASAGFFAGEWTEHLTSVPDSIGPLRATEILRRSTADWPDIVLGSSNGSPSIVVSATGAGRVMISGAMDAWRYREAGEGAFDRFWRGVVVEAAAQGAEVSIEFDDRIAAPGSTVPFRLRIGRMRPPFSEEVLARGRCDDGASQVIRVWPEGEAGTYSGDWSVGDASECQLDVAVVGGPRSSARVKVVTAPSRAVNASLAKLEQLVATTGGVSVNAADIPRVVEVLPPPAPSVRTATHPMHSPWWILPFASCLAGEWWLRRRVGLR